MKNRFKDALGRFAASTPPPALRNAQKSGDNLCTSLPPTTAPAPPCSFAKQALILIAVGLIFLALGVEAHIHPPISLPSRGIFRLAWSFFGPMGKAFFFYSGAFFCIVVSIYIWKRLGWIDVVLDQDRKNKKTVTWEASANKFAAEKAPSSVWRRFADDHLRWPAVTVLVTSFVIVYVIPVAWIRQIPGINSYLEFIPAHIPGIREYIAASKMPQIASVYFPIMALISPLLAFEIWQARFKSDRWTNSFWLNPKRNFLFTLWIGILMIGAIWANYGIGGGEVTSLSIKDSKIGLALLGAIYAGGGTWCFIGIFTRAIFSIISGEGRK